MHSLIAKKKTKNPFYMGSHIPLCIQMYLFHFAYLILNAFNMFVDFYEFLHEIHTLEIEHLYPIQQGLDR